MRTACSSSRRGGGVVCLSACWDTPPGCGPGDPLYGPGDPSTSPLGVGLEPSWPDPSTSPLGVDLETCKACWDTTPLCCKACWDTTCNACWDTTTTPPTPRGQNSWHTLLKILPCPKLRLQVVTRMHSSGMPTTCLLTISQHALWLGWCTCLGGCSCPGGVPARGVPAWGCMCTCPGGVPAQKLPLWTDRHLWKHNLRKLRLQAVIKWYTWFRGKTPINRWKKHQSKGR